MRNTSGHGTCLTCRLMKGETAIYTRNAMPTLTQSYEQGITGISSHLSEAIESSRSILDLPDNWDEEGSSAYAEDTWKRATKFVEECAIGYRGVSGVWIDPPKITPGPEGSIDVRWKSSTRSMLINFPANQSQPIQFFGSNGERDSIKGTLDLSSPNQWILMWLIDESESATALREHHKSSFLPERLERFPIS